MRTHTRMSCGYWTRESAMQKVDMRNWTRLTVAIAYREDRHLHWTRRHHHHYHPRCQNLPVQLVVTSEPVQEWICIRYEVLAADLDKRHDCETV